jgi:hypothetical protein
VIAERRVAAHLRSYGAVSPDKTMGYAPLRWSHARSLARLRDLGVVKGESGALWLDEIAWDERRGKQRKRTLALLALGAVSAGIAALTTWRG